jgi:hypothetical protein
MVGRVIFVVALFSPCFTRTTPMKTVGLLVLILIAVALAACEGQRIAQCDSTETNCYPRQGRPLQNQ